jgi:MFS family permease
MSMLLGRLQNRSLSHYPTNARRIWYLSLIVIATIVIYYELYTLTAVAPLVQAHFHLSLSVYAFSLVAANILSAFAALLGGFSDRFGRANMLVFGLLIASVCTLAMALSTSLWLFLLLYWGLGFLDGLLVTLTVALVRDFSPRLGRAAAMGFWTVGPIGGLFLANLMTGLTLPLFHSWQSQYVVAGSVGLVIFLTCLLGLRELSVGLRSQVMTSLQDSALVESRASQIEAELAPRHSWRQMVRPRLVISALGINFFLLLYLAARSFFVIFMSTSLKIPLAQANGILSILWIALVIFAIVVGFLSDATRVRKPYMLVGNIGLIIVTLIFISRIGQPTSAALLTVLLALMGICIALAYVPWYAAYTETVEDINPALVATGLGVEIFIGRWIGIITTLILPFVVGGGHGWETWLWVCLIGQVLFLPTILLVSGYWNPMHARRIARARAQAEIAAAQPNVG